MAIQDIRDITSFKWAQVTSVSPLAIRLDGDTAPLALIPDSLIDPLSLVVGDRVRVELSLRKVVIHGRSKGDPRVADLMPVQEWASKGGPASISAAYVTNWAKGIDSGGSIDATSDAQGFLIGETGNYEVLLVQRGGPSSTPAADYVGLALNGDRTVMESRAEGVWTHDHTPGSNMFSTSRYIGLLNSGEKVTGGAFSTSNNMLYGTATHTGMMQIRRIT